jgi:hypothetical protein
MSKRELKTCFFITPIGDEGTDERDRSDQVLEYIVKPAVAECGYDIPVRADQISEPGIITMQVIERLLNDDLVVADLTGRNPNVYYELAIRHAFRKPIVQIIDDSENLPFDVAPIRTIRFNYHDLASSDKCKRLLVEQIRATEKDPTKVDSPLSTAVDLLAFRQSDNPVAKSNAEIIASLQDIKTMIGNLSAGIVPRRSAASVSPTSGPVGTTLTFAGMGWAANTVVTIKWDGVVITTNPAVIVTDEDGAFSGITAIVPARAKSSSQVLAEGLVIPRGATTYSAAIAIITTAWTPLTGFAASEKAIDTRYSLDTSAGVGKTSVPLWHGVRCL